MMKMIWHTSDDNSSELNDIVHTIPELSLGGWMDPILEQLHSIIDDQKIYLSDLLQQEFTRALQARNEVWWGDDFEALLCLWLPELAGLSASIESDKDLLLQWIIDEYKKVKLAINQLEIDYRVDQWTYEEYEFDVTSLYTDMVFFAKKYEELIERSIVNQEEIIRDSGDLVTKLLSQNNDLLSTMGRYKKIIESIASEYDLLQSDIITLQSTYGVPFAKLNAKKDLIKSAIERLVTKNVDAVVKSYQTRYVSIWSINSLLESQKMLLMLQFGSDFEQRYDEAFEGFFVGGWAGAYVESSLNLLRDNYYDSNQTTLRCETFATLTQDNKQFLSDLLARIKDTRAMIQWYTANASSDNAVDKRKRLQDFQSSLLAFLKEERTLLANEMREYAQQQAKFIDQALANELDEYRVLTELREAYDHIPVDNTEARELQEQEIVRVAWRIYQNALYDLLRESSKGVLISFGVLREDISVETPGSDDTFKNVSVVIAPEVEAIVRVVESYLSSFDEKFTTKEDKQKALDVMRTSVQNKLTQWTFNNASEQKLQELLSMITQQENQL